MSAMETMAINLLRAVGVDPEMLKREFSTRVEQFEENIKRLNEHLTQINSRLKNIEDHLGIVGKEVTANDTGNTSENRENQNAGISRDGIGNSEPRLDPSYNAP